MKSDDIELEGRQLQQGDVKNVGTALKLSRKTQ